MKDFSISPISRRSAIRGMGLGALLLHPLIHAVRASGQTAKKTRLLIIWADHGIGGRDPASTVNGQIQLKECISPFNEIKSNCVFVNGVRMHSRASHFPKDWLTANLPNGLDVDAHLGTVRPLGPSIDALLHSRLNLPGVARLWVNGGRAMSFDENRNELSPTDVSNFNSQLRARIGNVSSTNIDPVLARKKAMIDLAREELQLFGARLNGEEKSKIDFHLSQMNTLATETGLNGGGQAGPGCIAPAVQTLKGFDADLASAFESIRVGFSCDYHRIGVITMGESANNIPYIDSKGVARIFQRELDANGNDKGTYKNDWKSGFDYHQTIAHSFLARANSMHQTCATYVTSGGDEPSCLNFPTSKIEGFSYFDGTPESFIRREYSSDAQAVYKSQCNQYARKVVDFIKSLQTTLDADGSTLFDNTIVVYGGSMEDGDHSTDALPFVIVGGANTGLKGNRIITPPRTSGEMILKNLGTNKDENFGYNSYSNALMGDLWVAIGRLMGMQNFNSFGHPVSNSTPLILS